jgi:gliding motility associated protien GldN
MFMNLKNALVSVALVGLVFSSAVAQEEPQYNPNSLNAIARYEQMYKLRVWRAVDLKEKQNKGFFANNGQISKLIVDAARTGELADIYQTDSLRSKYTKEEFLDKLVFQQGQTFPAWDPAQTYYLGDILSFNGKNYESQFDGNTGINPSTAQTTEWTVSAQGKASEFLPVNISRLNIAEDVIFDKRRSRLYYDIQALELQVFDDNKGIYVSLGWFKYKDCEKLFRDNPDKAVWFNRQNTAENRNFADAFLLRLFKGVIYKIENPDDESIEDEYRRNNRPYYESVWAREWAEMKLMEKEHNLWEF